MKFSFRSAAPLVMTGLLFSLVACKQEAKADAAIPAEAALSKDGKSDAAAAIVIKGLASEKDQASYMIGMDVAKSLAPIKGEVDIAVMAKAIEDSFAAKGVLMTEEQATKVREAFSAKIQAKQAAEAAEKAGKNLKEGADFLAANKAKPGVKTTESGLQYQVIREGSGAKPSGTDQVRVHYKGTLLDGSVFDSSYERNQPAEFALNQVIAGWSEGVALMPVGSKYQFWIPASLGYGEAGGGPIGPNAMLTFEVELMEIVAPTAAAATAQ